MGIGTKKLKIFLVDDQEDVLNDLEFSIGLKFKELNIDCDFVKASNRVSAIEQYKRNRDINIMVVDLGLNQESRETNFNKYMGLTFMEEVYREGYDVILLGYSNYTHEAVYNRCKKINAPLIGKLGRSSIRLLISEMLNLIEQKLKWSL